MTQKSAHKLALQRNGTQVAVFMVIFALIAITVLVIVRAAGGTVAVSGGAQLTGAVSYKTDDSNANGNYLSFGGESTDGVLPAGELPAYPKPPTANGSTIVRVTNNTGLMNAINDNSVRTIVMADGNYQNTSAREVQINGKNDKTLWAENKHGAVLEWNRYNAYDNMHISNSSNITIRGLAFRKAQNYAIKVGGAGYDWRGPNKNVLIEHILVDDSGQSGIAVDNGFGSGFKGNCFTALEDQTRNVTIRYNEFRKLGMFFGSIAFAEAIYTGSGGNCQMQDTVWDITIQNNIFDGTGQRGAGEAIGAKTNTRNLLVENNYIKNWQLTDATDGGAIGIWIDAGLPFDQRPNYRAGEKGLVVRGNYIDGVDVVDVEAAKAHGIMVGHQATIENNTVKNSVGAGYGLVLHGRLPQPDNRLIWGFSNQAENVVTFRNNTSIDNKNGIFDYGFNRAEFPIIVNASGNSPEITPFDPGLGVTFNIE